jgi:hypothetical protein
MRFSWTIQPGIAMTIAACSSVDAPVIDSKIDDVGHGASDAGVGGIDAMTDERAASDDRSPPSPNDVLIASDTSSQHVDGATATGDAAAMPGVERCGNGLDDDRDGMIDEGCPCAIGMSQSCYPGEARTRGVGACRDGMQRCEGTGEFGTWGSCMAATTPSRDVCGDRRDQDCNGAVDDGTDCCRSGEMSVCYSGPMGTAGRGICRAGARRCTVDGTPGTCMGEVLPRAESCNGLDDDCDGMIDEDCAACLLHTGTGSPWQIHLGEGPRCWGRTFSNHGDPGEYAFSTIPAETDMGWRPHAPASISFDDPSTLCGVCECRAGGDFTYFQTVFYVPPSGTVSSLRVTIENVDDGVSVALFNTRYPAGIVDPGAYAFLGGGSTADLARYVVFGRNRIVLTHIDDCCAVRRIANATVTLNGTALRPCM